MTDNNLRLSFDYRYPDEAAIIVYSTFGGGYIVGGDPMINIRKTIIGEKAVEIYSELTGKPVEDIRKEAGYTKNES